MSNIVVGKRYHSKAGNTIEIIQEIEIHDAEGKPHVRFTGKPVRTISGHEELMRKIQVFDSKGRWCSGSSVPISKGSIHDLTEECKDGK